MRKLHIFLFGLSLALAACGGDGDGGVDGGGDMDAGEPGGCAGESDGTACGTGLICLSGACVNSECGDGFVDEAGGEVCDDGNTEAFDGCEPGTCTPTCTDNTQCDDGVACNGAEQCTDSVCALGTPLADGDSCTLPMGGDGVCRTGTCVMAGCGNGAPDMGEQCDDGNTVNGDGCDTDCTFSCEANEDCIDGDVCNGEETCNEGTHVCEAGTMLDCVDGNECTMDLCDPAEGCQNPLIDGDMDGHAPDTLACGDDCDDTRPDVFTGAEELCDGVDNNCNTDIDEVAPTWFVDCDGDGFAADASGSRVGCTAPPASATGCGGGWTSVRPIDSGTTDCNPTNPDVFPGQTSYFTTAIPGEPGNFDYNCDGSESRQYFCTGSCPSRCSGGAGYTGCASICIGPCRFIEVGCGQTAFYRFSCRMLGTSCGGLGSDRTQACR